MTDMSYRFARHHRASRLFWFHCFCDPHVLLCWKKSFLGCGLSTCDRATALIWRCRLSAAQAFDFPAWSSLNINDDYVLDYKCNDFFGLWSTITRHRLKYTEQDIYEHKYYTNYRYFDVRQEIKDHAQCHGPSGAYLQHPWITTKHFTVNVILHFI